MSVGPDPQTIEQTRRQIQRLFEEVSRLSDLDLNPADYFGEFLKRVLSALAAPAGAVWVRTPQGNLQLQYQVNLQQVGLASTEDARKSHDELLRQSFQNPRPVHLPPQSYAGQPEAGQVAAGNPTDYILLLVPIQVENRVDGLLEVWQSPDRNPSAVNGFLQFMGEMTGLASRYMRNRLMRQMAGQQSLWTQLEAFSRQIHNSLNPIETAYQVANEGRRLIDCDRLSVALREGRKCKVAAVSGADVVERRSNLIQLMQKLFDRVLAWGEKLVYTGVPEEGLPPDVHHALDAYLAESNSKFLVVLPLKDEREKDSKKPPRSALLMESFEPTAAPEQMVSRLEIVGKHTVNALYNCVEHKRIPFRFLWMPLAKLQEGLGGKARAITLGVLAGLVGLACALYFVKYPLKIEATGSLLPEERVVIYSPVKGHVDKVAVGGGDEVAPGQNILLLRDQELADKLLQLEMEASSADQEARALERRLNDSRNLTGEVRQQLDFELISRRSTAHYKRKQRQELLDHSGAIPERAGYFWLRAPRFEEDRRAALAAGQDPLPAGEPVWTVLTPDIKENLPRKPVEPKDPLLRVGNKQGRWEVEMKIPQRHIGQVRQAFDTLNTDTLDVDFIVKSEPTRTFRGRLARAKIASEATPNRDDSTNPEPVVLAWVRIDGNDIPADRRLPLNLAPAGTEVHAKVRCGNHRMGYSLFYGIWEFLYEKVVFFF